MCARRGRGRGSGPAWVSRVEAGTVGRLRVYGLGYVVWVQVQVRRCCVGEGGCARLQVHAVAAAVAVGMLMATLRSGDEHRSRQDAPSPIGQPYEVLNTTYCYFRTFVVDKPSFPLRNKNLYAECMNWLYARLHHYNVRGLTNTIKYTPPWSPWRQAWLRHCRIRNKKNRGRGPLALQESTLLWFSRFSWQNENTDETLRRFLGPWTQPSSRSAAGSRHSRRYKLRIGKGPSSCSFLSSVLYDNRYMTQLAKAYQMQDEVYRRWILGSQDRGLWVPGHQY